MDTHEDEKKRKNQNYSNLLGQSLGDKSLRPEEVEGKNTLELNINEREEEMRERDEPRLLPSVHYSEFKNSGYYQEKPKSKSRLQEMDERTQRMREALLANPPSQQTIETQNPSEGRNFYKNAMGYGMNPINNTENRDIFGKKRDEHQGEVIVRDYRVQGYKYTLMKQTDKEIQAEFLKNGYHILNLTIVRDPISGDANGKVEFRARLMAEQERLFEHFLKTSMNFTIMGKK